MDNHKTVIRKFIAGYIDQNRLSDEDDLFKTGYVNSLFAMELVTFVENKFRITIENEELNIDNFRTINSIASLVSQKCNTPFEK